MPLLIAIALTVFWFTSGHMGEMNVVGFPFGICIGPLSVLVGQKWEHNKDRLLRVLFVLLSPIGIFILLPFSIDVAAGIFGLFR